MREVRQIPAMVAATRVASLALLCLTIAWQARADELPQPNGPVLLVVTGDIARSNGPDRASFDLEMLKQIGMTSLVTSAPWIEGQSRFEGVLARDLLSYVGARGHSITAVSLNDYLVEIPLKDFIDHDVIFALKRDGRFLGVRDMGPVLIVYPFDLDRSLWTESVFTRCVLQLKTVFVGNQNALPLATLTEPDPTQAGIAADPGGYKHGNEAVANQPGAVATQGNGSGLGVGADGTTRPPGASHDVVHSTDISGGS